MLLHLLGQHGRVLHGVPHQEGPAKAGAEGGLGLRDSHLSSSHLRHQSQNLPCGHRRAVLVEMGVEAWALMMKHSRSGCMGHAMSRLVFLKPTGVEHTLHEADA